MVVIGGGADEDEEEEEEEEDREDRDEAIIDACLVCGLRESVRPGYPNTARVADSPPEKPEREDWISAASIEFFWRLTDPSIPTAKDGGSELLLLLLLICPASYHHHQQR